MEWGTLLNEVDVDQFRASLGEVPVIVRRLELFNLLHQAQDRVSITLSARCLEISQDDRGAVAHFVDWTQVEEDFLIRADGLHSTVREELFGFAPHT